MLPFALTLQNTPSLITLRTSPVAATICIGNITIQKVPAQKDDVRRLRNHNINTQRIENPLASHFAYG